MTWFREPPDGARRGKKAFVLVPEQPVEQLRFVRLSRPGRGSRRYQGRALIGCRQGDIDEDIKKSGTAEVLRFRLLHRRGAEAFFF